MLTLTLRTVVSMRPDFYCFYLYVFMYLFLLLYKCIYFYVMFWQTKVTMMFTVNRPTLTIPYPTVIVPHFIKNKIFTKHKNYAGMRK